MRQVDLLAQLKRDNMEINNYNKWKKIPIMTLCTKRYSKNEEERLWYAEWRDVYTNIINMLANYLNKKDPKWDMELDEETLTTEELIRHMRLVLEQKGIDFKSRVEIVMKEREKRRR